MTIENSSSIKSAAHESTPVLMNEESGNDSDCIPTQRTVAGVLTTIVVAATTGAIGGATAYGLFKLCSAGGALTAPSAPATTWVGCGAGSGGGLGGVFTATRFFREKSTNNPQLEGVAPTPTPRGMAMNE